MIIHVIDRNQLNRDNLDDIVFFCGLSCQVVFSSSGHGWCSMPNIEKEELYPPDRWCAACILMYLHMKSTLDETNSKETL